MSASGKRGWQQVSGAAAERNPAPGQADWRQHHAALILLGVACVAAYANALLASFQFDDHNVIVNNPAVHGLAAWWASMPGIRPLLKLSYTLNWARARARSASTFSTSGATSRTHCWCTCWPAAGCPGWAPWVGATVPAACTAALVFALHPAQTEAVTYVAGLVAVPDGLL